MIAARGKTGYDQIRDGSLENVVVKFYFTSREAIGEGGGWAMAARHLAPFLERVEGGGRLALPCTSVQTHLYQRTGSRCGRAETVKFVSTGKRKRLNTTRYIGHPPVVLSRLRHEVFHLRHAGRYSVYALTRVRHHLSSPVARASTRIYALLCTVSVWIHGQGCR